MHLGARALVMGALHTHLIGLRLPEERDDTGYLTADLDTLAPPTDAFGYTRAAVRTFKREKIREVEYAIRTLYDSLSVPERSGEACALSVEDARGLASAVLALRRVESDGALISSIVDALIGAPCAWSGVGGVTEALVLFALAEHEASHAADAAPPRVAISLDGQSLEPETSASGTTWRVSIPNHALGDGRLEFSRSDVGGPLHVHMAMDVHAGASSNLPAYRAPFALERTYVYADGPRAGEPLDGLVPVGTLIEVQITILRGVFAFDLKTPVLTDALPGGMTYVDMAPTVSRRPNHGRARVAEGAPTVDASGRLRWHITDMSNSSNTLTYRAITTTPGTFTAPPARVALTDAPRVSARSLPATVHIE
jgi:hypothetical protein